MLTPWQLVNRDTGAVVVESLELADGFWSRFVGLQFRSGLPAGRGLLLVPCASIHTFFVRFPLDLVMLNRKGVVVDARTGIRPWRIVLPVRHTFAILELAAHTAIVERGATLRLERTADSAPVPRSLRFLAS